MWQLTTKTWTMKRYVTKPTSKIKNKEINLFIIWKCETDMEILHLPFVFFSVIIITVLVVTCKWSVARIVTYDTYVVYKTRDNVSYLAPRKEFKIRREENYFTESLLELWVVWHCAISPFWLLDKWFSRRIFRIQKQGFFPNTSQCLYLFSY